MTGPQPQYAPGAPVLVAAVVQEGPDPEGDYTVAVHYAQDIDRGVYVRAADVHPVPPTPDPRDTAIAEIRAKCDAADGHAAQRVPRSTVLPVVSTQTLRRIIAPVPAPSALRTEEAATTAPATTDDDRVERAAVALAKAQDADSCFDPLFVEDGYVSETARDEYESGAEDREWFRRGAQAVLAAEDAHRAAGSPS